jgi:dTDP-4-dehydrorhamnose 3,5-epimerase
MEIDIPKLLTFDTYPDERGDFSVLLERLKIQEIYFNEIIQMNFSRSRKGVVRGLHLQTGSQSQAKLIYCLRGKIIDFAVDLRHESPTFGMHWKFELRATKSNLIYVPKGFGHGFKSNSRMAQVLYLVDSPYVKEAEVSINPLDLTLNLDWGGGKKLLSKKDRDGISFESWISGSKRAK